MDHDFSHLIAVVKLTPPNKLKEVVIEGNSRLCIKGEGVHDIVRGVGDHLVSSFAWDLPTPASSHS